MLKAIENEGSALSADYIGRTMDEMYKSGKLQPKDYGECYIETQKYRSHCISDRAV